MGEVTGLGRWVKVFVSGRGVVKNWLRERTKKISKEGVEGGGFAKMKGISPSKKETTFIFGRCEYCIMDYVPWKTEFWTVDKVLFGQNRHLPGKMDFFKFWNFQGGGSLGKQKNLSGALLELSKGKAGLSEPPPSPSPSPCPCAGLTFKFEREAKNPISGTDAALPHPVHISEPGKKTGKVLFLKKSVAVSIQLSNKTIIFLECHTAANMHFCLKMFKPALSENMD